MNTIALIEEIKSDLSKYADAGLIDENSLYRDIVLGLRRFGNDICEIQDKVVEVKNGSAELPKNFFYLRLAALCEPLGYKTNCKTDVEFHHLQSSHYYREKVIMTDKWNECDPCCNEVEENVIKENLYFKESKVDFYYHNPQLLKLGKTFKKDNCISDCRNKLVKDNPNEININNFTLYANFPEGDIYIQYYGIPTNEDGSIEIPSTPNGHLETYIEYYLKRRLVERLMGNNDAQGLANLYNVYKQEEQIALKNASAELKMKSLTPGQMKRISRLNRWESLRYEVISTRWR